MSGAAVTQRPVVMRACETEAGFRIELIREVGEALAAKAGSRARLTIGVPLAQKAPTLPALPIGARRLRLEAATAWLKARCILVSVCDRGSDIRRYRVTGRRPSLLLEEVIEYAEALGMNANG